MYLVQSHSFSRRKEITYGGISHLFWDVINQQKFFRINIELYSIGGNKENKEKK